MHERKGTALMNNDCFISAIYLDPRVNSILTDEQLEKARDHLVQTYQRAVQLLSTNNVNSTALEESEVPDEELSSSRSTITELDAFLRAQFRRRQQNMLNFNSEHNFKRILIEFLNQPLLAASTNILNYWHSMKIREPQLYLLSNIILATPPTQVSVERLFSSLKFVMNNLRMSLKDEIIDVLVIRNNALYDK
ncbi:unnamed protein product [Euphydryas editha]|uniref:HAT C-terminal dimerisation domain-containing protein n=1 Tax=Euphydryas editha TaxID=104508 RepID=A0AAU9TMT4_EUPED|nr:unnamed protein product [Euphydryas editha]